MLEPRGVTFGPIKVTYSSPKSAEIIEEEKGDKDLNWTQIETIIRNKNISRLLMFGPPGTGKTSAAVKASQQRGFYNVTLHADMSAQELIGHFVPTGGGAFDWHDGPAIRAWREGATLILNEIDLAAGPVMTELLNIMDDKSIAQKTLTSGEKLHPDENFRVIATMNGEPQDLPGPLMDRFDAMILVDEPSPEAIKRLAEKLQKVVINSYASGAPTITYRKALSVTKLVEDGLTLKLAVDAVFNKGAADIYSVIQMGTR